MNQKVIPDYLALAVINIFNTVIKALYKVIAAQCYHGFYFVFYGIVILRFFIYINYFYYRKIIFPPQSENTSGTSCSKLFS